ncbi:outer membrane lipoprotein-sorting protein [Elusimicrobiota bacterium]
MKLIVFFFSIFISFTDYPCAEDISGKEIAQKVIDYTNIDTSRMNMKMILIPTRGTRSEREMIIWSKDYGEGRRKNLIKFSFPLDVKDTGLLIWSYEEGNDDQWLYLPALRRVRRISGSQQDKSFVGSDLSYADMSSIYREVEKDTHTLLDMDMIDGNECYVVESTPLDSKYQYSKYTRWIRKDNFVPVKITAYDRKGKYVKLILGEDIAKIDGVWLARRTIVENIKSGHKTILEIDPEYNIDLSDELFIFSQLRYGIRFN